MLPDRRREMTKVSWLMLAVAAVTTAVACGKGSPRGRDAEADGRTTTADAPGDRSEAGDDLATAGPDADPILPAEFMPPVPPEKACAGDGGATECDLPPSTCAQPRGCDAGFCYSPWIAYYENPRCVAGRCVWDTSYFECLSVRPCQAGACTPAGTLVP